jgi:hypothetical protein
MPESRWERARHSPHVPPGPNASSWNDATTGHHIDPYAITEGPSSHEGDTGRSSPPGGGRRTRRDTGTEPGDLARSPGYTDYPAAALDPYRTSADPYQTSADPYRSPSAGHTPDGTVDPYTASAASWDDPLGTPGGDAYPRSEQSGGRRRRTNTRPGSAEPIEDARGHGWRSSGRRRRADEEQHAPAEDWDGPYPHQGRADEFGHFPSGDGGALSRDHRADPYGHQPDPYQRYADPYQRQAEPYQHRPDPYLPDLYQQHQPDPHQHQSDPYQHLAASYGRQVGVPQHRSHSYDDQSDAYHHGPDFLDEVTGSYTPYAESLDDLPAPVGDPLTGPIPGLTPDETHESRPMTGRAEDSEPDWYAPLGARRDRHTARRETSESQRWDETQPHDWSQETGWDLARHREAAGTGETTTSSTAVPAGLNGRGDVPSQARRRPDYDEYPADLRPRRSNPGALAGPYGEPRSSGPAVADRHGRGYDDMRDPRGLDGDDWIDSHPGRDRRDDRDGSYGRDSRNGRATHPPHAGQSTRSGHPARAGQSTRSGHPTRTGHSARGGRGFRRRSQRGRLTGLPAPLAVALALTGSLGSAFLDLLVTGGLGMLFSMGFVMTSFGVAAGIRRSDVFTAGVMPPLAALATFVAVGVAAPNRLSEVDNVSPVIAVLAGLASESWTLVAASALALGTVALRVALGYRELSQDEPSEGLAAAPAAGRRSGSRPRS